MLNLVNDRHIIGNLEVMDKNYPWVDTVIRRIAKQKKRYCYTEEKNESLIALCAANKNYTILPSIIVDENPYKTIKEQVQSGSIISMKINQTVINELPSIIKYLQSKDYRITNLETHLSEENYTF